MVGTIEPTVLESSTALSNVLLQSGGSGEFSWQFLLLVGIGATVVLALAWILFGTTE